MQSWETRTRTVVLAQPPFLTVENHTVVLPDGRTIDDWAWVITPDFVNVAVITPDDRFVCFRQTKYAIDGLSLAPVGGYCEPGEDTLVAAQRETREETGYTAPDWQTCGSYAVDGNRGAGVAHLFVARNATPTHAINRDDLEEQELVLLTRDEVTTALAAGEFRVLPWATVMALALLATA